MIDYIPGGAVDIHSKIQPFQIKQYDNNSHKLHLTIIDRDNPFGQTVDLRGHSVRAYFILPDGSDEFIDCEIVRGKSGKIAVPFPGSVTQQTGTVECELCIIGESNSIISLRKFSFDVVESIRDTSAMEASEKYSALEAALSAVQGFSNDIDAAVADVQSMRESVDADIQRLRDDLDNLLESDRYTELSAEIQRLKNGLDNLIASDRGDELDAVISEVQRLREVIENLDVPGTVTVTGEIADYISTTEEFLSLFDFDSDVGTEDPPVVETAPSTPTGLTAAYDPTTGKVIVSWDAVTGANSYTLRKQSGGVWSQLQSSSARSYTDSSVTAGASYQYEVTAHKTGSSGQTLSSSAVTVTVTVPSSTEGEGDTAPNKPTISNVSAGTGSITVRWNDVDADYYKVERTSNGGSSYTTVSASTTGTSYTDKSAAAGTSYQYAITAYRTVSSGTLNSGRSDLSNAVAIEDSTGNVTLSAPASVSATGGSGSIAIGWDGVSGASRYKLERSSDNGSTWTTLLLYQTEPSYNDSTVVAGTAYKYRVTAYSSSGGRSEPTVSSSATAQSAPAAVIGGTAITTAETAATVVGNITVGWNLGNTLDCCNDPVQLRTGQANRAFGAGIRSIGSENEGKAYETSWGDTPITTQEMLEAVVNAGFNAIRIPVTWNHHLRDAALPYDWGVDVIDSGRYTTDIPLYPNLSGTVIISPFFLKRVKEVVNMALNAGFRYVILDTHHDTADFNAASSRTLYYAKNVTGLPWLTDIPYQLFHCSNRLGPRLENVDGMTAEKDFQNMCDYMYKIWTMIATEFKDYDYRLIFEGFNEMLNWARAWDQTYHAGNGNEVTATQHQRFNAFNNTFIKAVRNAGGAYNPTRVLSCETFGATTTDFIVNGFNLSNVPDSFRDTNYCLTGSEISAENSRIILQAHYYNDVPNNFRTAAESVASAGLPVIFGEVGWHVNSSGPSDLYNFGYNLVQKAKSAGAKVFWWDNNKTGTGKDCYGVLNRWNTKNGSVVWDKEALKNGLIAGAAATV